MRQIMRSKETILAAWEQLKHEWEKASSQWHDAARLRFEREYWQVYEPAIAAYIKQLDNLDRVIDQARREVE